MWIGAYKVVLRLTESCLINNYITSSTFLHITAQKSPASNLVESEMDNEILSQFVLQ